MHTNVNSPAFQEARRAMMKAQVARGARYSFLGAYNGSWCRCSLCSAFLEERKSSVGV